VGDQGVGLPPALGSKNVHAAAGHPGHASRAIRTAMPSPQAAQYPLSRRLQHPRRPRHAPVRVLDALRVRLRVAQLRRVGVRHLLDLRLRAVLDKHGLAAPLDGDDLRGATRFGSGAREMGRGKLAFDTCTDCTDACASKCPGMARTWPGFTFLRSTSTAASASTSAEALREATALMTARRAADAYTKRAPPCRQKTQYHAGSTAPNWKRQVGDDADGPTAGKIQAGAVQGEIAVIENEHELACHPDTLRNAPAQNR
jgi:hypothetical protein